MFRWINGRNPRQYGLGLRIVDAVVGGRVSRAEVRHSAWCDGGGRIARELGLTPKKPLQRAYQRDPEAIDVWRHKRYPAIVQTYTDRRGLIPKGDRNKVSNAINSVIRSEPRGNKFKNLKQIVELHNRIYELGYNINFFESLKLIVECSLSDTPNRPIRLRLPRNTK